jgi:hypothetical protein
MKLFSLFMLTIAVCTATAPAKTYRFRVIGYFPLSLFKSPHSFELTIIVLTSGNSAIDNAFLRTNGTTTPGVTLPPYSRSDPTCVTQLASNLSTLWVPTRFFGWYVLQGPSGKGNYGLQQSWDPNPRGFGSSVLYTNWVAMKTENGNMLLRYSDNYAQSHWIAVRTVTDGYVKWVPRWVSPNSANMGDNEFYVLIDIELVEVGLNDVDISIGNAQQQVIDMEL